MTEQELKSSFGFKWVGSCLATDKGFDIQPRYQEAFSENKLVYAIGINGEIKYIGATYRGINGRFSDYMRQKSATKQDEKIRTNIVEALSRRATVNLLAWMDDDLWHFGGLDINRYLSVEDALIEYAGPSWNQKGTSGIKQIKRKQIKG